MKTINLKELRNALSCWQDDYDCDDDKEQYDMFGAAIDAASRLEAAEMEIEGLKRFQELNLKIKQAMHERFTRAERERDELRAEQAEHDEQIARMESKFSLTKRALDSKTARCEKAEAELRRRDAAAGEPVAWKWRLNSLYDGSQIGPWRVCLAPQEPGSGAGCETESIPLYTVPQPAVLPPEIDDIWDATNLPCMATSNLDERECCVARDAYNQCRADAMALGAQQQKVVELPDYDEPTKVGMTWDAGYNHGASDCVKALDAAGVKWEVKK